jgi:hypothetical protein
VAESAATHCRRSMRVMLAFWSDLRGIDLDATASSRRPRST